MQLLQKMVIFRFLFRPLEKLLITWLSLIDTIQQFLGHQMGVIRLYFEKGNKALYG